MDVFGPDLGRPVLLHKTIASKFLAAISTFLCIALFASAAFAQEDTAKMKELVKQGTEAFSQKRYADAAQLFEEAYEAKANSTLLKNAMVAWYKGNECDKALHAGARFFREATDANELEAKDTSEIQTVISCSLNLAQQRIDEKKFSEAEDLLFTATSAGPSDEQNNRIASLRQQLREKREANAGNGGSGDGNGGDTTQPDDGEGISTLALTGWAVTGVGVAGLIGSAVYSATAASTERDAIDKCVQSGQVRPEDFSCLATETGRDTVTREIYEDEIAAEVSSAQSTSIILYSVSGAVTAVGVGILIYHYFVATPEEPAPTVMLTPMIGEDTAGATLLWRF